MTAECFKCLLQTNSGFQNTISSATSLSTDITAEF